MTGGTYEEDGRVLRKQAFDLLKDLTAAHPDYTGSGVYPREPMARDMGYFSYATLIGDVKVADYDELVVLLRKATLVLKAYGPGPFTDLARIESGQVIARKGSNHE